MGEAVAVDEAGVMMKMMKILMLFIVISGFWFSFLFIFIV